MEEGREEGWKIGQGENKRGLKGGQERSIAGVEGKCN